jgi:hypothetical protein
MQIEIDPQLIKTLIGNQIKLKTPVDFFHSSF